MPYYDYACSDCQEEFDAIRKMDERATATCPVCGAIGKQKLSMPMVKLDGTDPSFPGAYAAWNKKRIKKMAQEQKQLEN